MGEDRTRYICSSSRYAFERNRISLTSSGQDNSTIKIQRPSRTGILAAMRALRDIPEPPCWRIIWTKTSFCSDGRSSLYWAYQYDAMTSKMINLGFGLKLSSPSPNTAETASCGRVGVFVAVSIYCSQFSNHKPSLWIIVDRRLVSGLWAIMLHQIFNSATSEFLRIGGNSFLSQIWNWPPDSLLAHSTWPGALTVTQCPLNEVGNCIP